MDADEGKIKERQWEKGKDARSVKKKGKRKKFYS
jgi:hypothetical protein